MIPNTSTFLDSITLGIHGLQRQSQHYDQLRLINQPKDMAKSSSKRGIMKKTAEQLRDENFRRQNVTYAEKGDRFREDFGADVFILVLRKGKLTIYTSRNSLDDPQWPLRPEEIASYYPKLIRTPETFKIHEKKPETTPRA